MSSFSSVVLKPGQKIKPRVAARRVVQRIAKPSPAPTPENTADAAVPVSDPQDDHESNGQASQDQISSVTAQARNLPSETTSAARITSSQGTHTSHLQDCEHLTVRASSIDSTKPALARKASPTSSNHPGPRPKPRRSLRDTKDKGNAGVGPDVRAQSPVVRNSGDTSELMAQPTTSISTQTRRTRSQRSPIIVPTQAQINSTEGSQDTISEATMSADDRQAQLDDNPFQTIANRLESISGMIISLDTRHNVTGSQQRQANVMAQPKHIANNTPRSAPSTKPRRRQKTIQEQAAEVVSNVIGDRTLAPALRALTPENAEAHQLEPSQVTMGELVKDNRLGKKSALEAEMQANWGEIQKRRREEIEQSIEQAQKRRKRVQPQDLPMVATEQIVARTRLINGRIVMDEDSREVDRTGHLARTAAQDLEHIREDKIYYKRVNQATVGMKPGYGHRFRWDEQSTERFFRGLRMFGTDFLMIANLFPGVDRKQVKMKFIREENADKAKVMEHLANREQVDLDEYARETNTTLHDVAAIEQEMKDEEERLRKEDDERRKREGFLREPNGEIVLPTTEESIEPAESDEHNQSRFASEAAEIMAPRRQRKATTVSKRRGPKAGRRPAEGIEERLGTIDEVSI